MPREKIGCIHAETGHKQMRAHRSLALFEPEEIGKQCVCSRCPVNPEGGSFCVDGKSVKPPIRKGGCICKECPVWGENIRLACHFCIYGSAPVDVYGREESRLGKLWSKIVS